MMTGYQNWSNAECILDKFKDEDGFSSHVYALAILLSLALIFSLATSQWVMQKTSSIQTVADSAALSASNTSASFKQITQVADAVIFTIGITGVISIGIGFVMSCVPAVSSYGVELTDFGVRTIRARNRAADKIYRVLENLERAMPFLIGGSAARTIAAQSNENFKYHGYAICFPMQSESTYPDSDTILISDDITQKAKELAENTAHEEAYNKQKDKAQEDGWYADCGNPEHSLYERAAHLGHLQLDENPYYPSPEQWTFAAPILRSRAYYKNRYDAEHPEGSEIDEVRSSECRKYFYKHATDLLKTAYYIENDNYTDIYIPKLPATLDDYKNSELYTDKQWLADESYIHVTQNCPHIHQPHHLDSLSKLEGSDLSECPYCRLSISDVSLVTRLTSVNPTGYEYWYIKVQEASERYKEASDKLDELQKARRAEEDEIADRYKEVLEQFSLQRVKFVPPGARGSIALVYREQGAKLPSKLKGPFAEEKTLPAGYAISASALAPDASADTTHMLNGLVQAIVPKNSEGGIVGICLDIWGDLLVGYGKKVDSLNQGLDSASENIGSLASPYLQRIKSLLNRTLAEIGLEPVDMKIYKPTLVQSIKVIDNEVDFDVAHLYSLFQSIPTNEFEFLNFTLPEYGIEIEDGYIKLVDINLPFLDEPISINIPMGVLWQGA